MLTGTNATMEMNKTMLNISGVDILDRITHPKDFISDEVDTVIRLTNYVILSGLIAWFGIVTNIINMIVFYRQGFTTTTNISFFALAISDILCLTISEWLTVCLNRYVEESDIPFISSEIQHLAGGWLHVCFGRITSWITVFITAERCMGVALPLKVKQIITLRRTTIVMCLIFAVNFSTLIPEYVITYWDWKFVPGKNRTLLGIVYRSYKDQCLGLSYSLTSVSGVMSFVSVIILTIFLVAQLKLQSKWRGMAMGGSDNLEAVSSKDKKAMKMIIIIATVLIVCYIPGTIASLVSALVSEFMIGRAYSNSYISFWSIAFVFDIINSSVNVFIYYRMSTKYRQTFNQLFSACVKTNNQQTVVSGR